MTEPASTIIWDLPTRLFHWALVVLILLQYLSGEFELLPMEWHFWLGYATLALVVFRILWGFFGSTTSRFATFVRGPGAVLRYVRGMVTGRDVHAVGHNPLGGWSVLLLIACVFVQSITGLFSSDDLTETGPLAARVSDATVEWMTDLHEINQTVLIVLIVLHVAAVLLHRLRGDNLVPAMIHGRGRGDGVPMRIASTWLAAVLLAISAIAVALVVTFGASA
jgi:cytochrome b